MRARPRCCGSSQVRSAAASLSVTLSSCLRTATRRRWTLRSCKRCAHADVLRSSTCRLPRVHMPMHCVCNKGSAGAGLGVFATCMPMLQVFQKTRTPYSIETRKGFPPRVADLRRVRISAASTVFIMQPDANTIVSPKSHESGPRCDANRAERAEDGDCAARERDDGTAYGPDAGDPGQQRELKGDWLHAEVPAVRLCLPLSCLKALIVYLCALCGSICAPCACQPSRVRHFSSGDFHRSLFFQGTKVTKAPLDQLPSGHQAIHHRETVAFLATTDGMPPLAGAWAWGTAARCRSSGVRCSR